MKTIRGETTTENRSWSENFGRIGFYPWYVAGVLALAQVMSNLDRYLMSVVLEPVKTDLVLTDSQLGLLSGLSFAIVFCIASLPLGRLADISNRRIIIFIGICCWSAATVACSFANSFTQLFIARLGVGLGEAALLPAAVSLIAAYFPRDMLTKGLAVFTTGNSMGRAAAFLGGGALFMWLVGHGGLAIPAIGHFRPWQGVMLIAGLTGFAVALLCLTIREPARKIVAKEELKFSKSFSFFRQNADVYLRMFLLYGLAVGAAMALATWTISLYVRNYNVPVGTASIIVGLTSLIIGPFANMAGGWLTDRLNTMNVPAAGILVSSAVLAFLPVAGLSFWLLHGLGFAILTYVVSYFGLVMVGPACLGALQYVTPDQHRGVVSSLYLSAYSLLGYGLGPLIVGLFSDYVFKSEGTLHLSLAATFFIFAVIGVPISLSGRSAYQRLADMVHKDEK